MYWNKQYKKCLKTIYKRLREKIINFIDIKVYQTSMYVKN